MSATNADPNENLDLNQLDIYRSSTETSQSNPELVARVAQILEWIEESEEGTGSSRDEVESEQRTDLTENEVRGLIEDHAVSEGDLTPGDLRQTVGDAADAQYVNNSGHISSSRSYASEDKAADQGLHSVEFRNFVKGSTVISTSLLLLFTILGVQGLIAANIAAVFAGILSVSTIMFGKTWYDLPKN